jgi:hypothetical protein
MVPASMQKLAVLDSAAACAVERSKIKIMLTTQPHSSQYQHQQHISTHNVVRDARFANTFDGSAVIWFCCTCLLRHTQGESTARSQTVLYQKTKVASIKCIPYDWHRRAQSNFVFEEFNYHHQMMYKGT